MIQEFGTTQPKSLEDKIDTLTHTVDRLAIAMANGFSSLQSQISSINSEICSINSEIISINTEIGSIKATMGGMATKADILALYDKFPSNQTFDALAVRVGKLEAKKS